MKIKDFFSKKYIILKNNVSLYVCGPTVYKEPHIGNMRPIIIFDVLNRVLSIDKKITFVHNITDVDDKIIFESKLKGISEKELTNKYINIYLDLMNKLNIKNPTYMPRVTENIGGMIDFIQSLIDKGFAYESNGSIYFSINSYNDYGLIDNLSLDMLIDANESKDKKDIKDFVLWKKTFDGIKFDSKWSKGRPGWHTECAYFIEKYFGESGIDVHGGGIDLKFPHHINEMAQYSAKTNHFLAKAWYYIGHLTIDLTKMSKSKNNFINARDFIKEHGAKVLRYILISTSATKPINLTDEIIKNAKNSLDKFKNVITKVLINLSNIKEDILISKPSIEFLSILNNDLNIPLSITYLMDLVKKLNNKNTKRKELLVGELIANLSLLGFDYKINFYELRDKINNAKKTSNFKILDELKEELVK